MSNNNFWRNMFTKDNVRDYQQNWFGYLVVLTIIWAILSAVVWGIVVLIEEDTRFGIDHRFKHTVERVEACEGSDKKRDCLVRVEDDKFYDKLRVSDYPGGTQMAEGDRILLEVWFYEYHADIKACRNGKCYDRNTCWIMYPCWRNYKDRVAELMEEHEDDPDTSEAIEVDPEERDNGFKLYDPAVAQVGE